MKPIAILLAIFALVAVIWLINSFNIKRLSPSELVIKSAIEAHGGKAYQTAAIRFQFRERTYSIRNQDDAFEYTSTWQVGDTTISDTLTNTNFWRTINGLPQSLNDEDAAKYASSLGSVVYFAQLPYKLEDPAVQSKYIGEATVKGELYHVIQVTFAEEGGGTDYEDEYCYWIHKTNFTVDYFAYNYRVNDKGARFRVAYHPRKVGKLRIQDYINYEADFETPLQDLAKMYEQDQLRELSRIDLILKDL